MNLELKLKLRENKLIRTIMYPLKRLEGLFEESHYRSVDAPKRIKAFRGIHSGKRCFIIGNGPSLTTMDLEKLRNEYTFASNRIYRLYDQTDWRPSYWMCVDPNIIQKDAAIIPKLKGVKFVSSIAGKYGIEPGSDLYYVYNHQRFAINKYSVRKKIAFSEDAAVCLESGETVTYNAIQLAVYMGFTEIILLGVDHSYSQTVDEKGKMHYDASIKDYFGNVKTESFNIQNKAVATKAFRVARKYAENHSISIYNATRGGKLDVFPRIDLDDIL